MHSKMRRFTQQCPQLRALHATVRQRVRQSPLVSAPVLASSSPNRFQQFQICSNRHFHGSNAVNQNAPDQPPPTNFQDLDVLGNTPVPSTSVDVCMADGFGLNSGITIGDGDGALLVNGEAFTWRPWEVKGKMEMVNAKGQFEIPAESLGVFSMLWPRPDLLIIGAGKQILPLSPETRKKISELGMRIEVLDTRNAASQFNMLATERGVDEVAAVLIPIGWEEGVGAKEL